MSSENLYLRLRDAVHSLPGKGKWVPPSKLEAADGLAAAAVGDLGDVGDSGLDNGELKTEEIVCVNRPPTTVDSRRRKAISNSGISSSPIRLRLCF